MAAIAAALRRTPRRLLLLPRPRPLCTSPSPNPTPNPSPSPNPKPLSALLSAIKSEPDPDRIADLLESSSHLPRFYSDRPLHALALRRLSRLRRPDLIQRVLQSQISDPKSPKSEGFFTRILFHYASSGLLDDAVRLFHQIPNPTQLSFCALLSALLNHRKYDLAIEKFETLPKSIGIEPGLVAHSLYLKALCFKGDTETVRKVLDEMVESKGLAPDIVCYNAVLYGYMKSGDADGFAGILGEIEKRGLEPNVFTYNCRIAMFCGKSQSFKGEEILDVMESKGLVPNLCSFNELIDGFCKEGDLESAVRVFKRMKVMKRANGKEGFSPNSQSYVLLTKSLVEKGEFGLGLEICKESLIRKFVPPFEIVKGLVEGLAKNEKVEEAKDIIEKMNLVVTGEAVDAWKKIESSLAL